MLSSLQPKRRVSLSPPLVTGSSLPPLPFFLLAPPLRRTRDPLTHSVNRRQGRAHWCLSSPVALSLHAHYDPSVHLSVCRLSLELPRAGRVLGVLCNWERPSASGGREREGEPSVASPPQVFCPTVRPPAGHGLVGTVEPAQLCPLHSGSLRSHPHWCQMAVGTASWMRHAHRGAHLCPGLASRDFGQQPGVSI